MKQPLTPAQQETYDWIAHYVARHRIAPTIRETMVAMGLKAPFPAQQRLAQLKRKGWIDWQEGKARSIALSREMTVLDLDEEELAALRNVLYNCRDVPALARIFARIDDSGYDEQEDTA